MKRGVFIAIFAVFAFSIEVSAQNERTNLYVYVNKLKQNYTSYLDSAQRTIKTTRLVTLYNFEIKSQEHVSGSIVFFGHNNPETGLIFDPIKTISKKDFKKLSFTTFEDLLFLLKQYDTGINSKYKLYFVEKKDRKYFMYNVRFMNTFLDE